MNLPDKWLKCPQCGGELAPEDVNVAQDAAMCRACRYAGPFLNALVVPKLTDEQLARPPRRVKLQRGFGDALTLTVRPRRWALLFLVPFTLFWSGGALAGIYGSQLWKGEFDPKLSLFGLPFLLASLGLLTAILYMVFGRTVVTLAKGCGERSSDASSSRVSGLSCRNPAEGKLTTLVGCAGEVSSGAAGKRSGVSSRKAMACATSKAGSGKGWAGFCKWATHALKTW